MDDFIQRLKNMKINNEKWNADIDLVCSMIKEKKYNYAFYLLGLLSITCRQYHIPWGDIWNLFCDMDNWLNGEE